MSAVWPQTNNLLVLPRGYQAEIRDPVEAQSLIVQLLAVLDGCHQGPRSSISWRNADEEWVIENCYRVLDICSGRPSMSDQAFDYVHEQVSRLLRLHVKGRCPKRRIGPIAELLVSAIEGLNPRYHPRSIAAFTTAIDELREASSKNSRSQAYLQQRVAPILQNLAAQISDSFDLDLQTVLRQTLAQLSDQPRNPDIDSRPSKRLRLSHQEPDANNRIRKALVEDISEQLSGERTSVLPDLGGAAMSKLRELDNNAQIAAINNIGLLPCVLDKAVTLVVEGQRMDWCKVCDSIASEQQFVIDKDSVDTANAKTFADFLGFIVRCVEDAQLKRSKKFRIVCANTLRRLASHINSTDHSLLAFDGIGQWLMRSLQSSVRELRVAAAQALVPYLRDDLPQDVRQRNRIDTLDFLKRLADKGILHVQETLTFAWSLIGQTCGGPELNIALIQLVDYLGHSHPLISGAAYHEIIQLARYRDCAPAELIRPYWKSLAIHVVKDVYVCPQKIQQLSDVLCISVGELLIQTQTETIPYLILTRKRDVLQRIAQARGPSTNVHDLWLQPSRNIAAVLAFLLIQPLENSEQNAIALLREASPDFAEADLSGLVKLEPIQTACEILKYAADYPDVKKGHAHQGLRLLAQINERKSGASKTSRSSKMLGTFLEAHILGIMSHFTDIIDTPMERQPLSEKKRALSAVEQLIMVGGAQIIIAIPQIRATLQSASKIPDLVEPAFITWSALVTTAGEEEVESLIDQTFAVIIHHWNSFGSNTQTRAYDTIAGLLKNHNTMIRDRIQLLPSLAGVQILQKFESEICRLKNNVDPILHFEAYAIRCGDENTIIVRRAFQDLGPFLELHQGVIHDSAISQQPSPVIARLSRVLLDAIMRFKETDTTISELAAKCLGAIGSIDPNKVDESRTRHDILMLSNFEKAEEVINFVVDLLDRVLVDAFHSAPTGKAQTYLAYAMQELLKFCGFRQVLYKARSSQAGALYDRWVEIPEATRSTLTPFFNTRYALVHPSAPSGDDTFPILRPGMSHGTWLRTFVFKLLHQATTENTGMIFPVLSRIIWGHDISIPTFLLPFVVLNIVVNPNDQHTSAIVTEFLRVLSIDLDGVDDSSANEIKQCSEVSAAAFPNRAGLLTAARTSSMYSTTYLVGFRPNESRSMRSEVVTAGLCICRKTTTS
jgi:serine/threonine-protein kinase ATR